MWVHVCVFSPDFTYTICIFISARRRRAGVNSIKLSQLKHLCCFCIFRHAEALILIPRAEFLLFRPKSLIRISLCVLSRAAHTQTRPLCVLRSCYCDDPHSERGFWWEAEMRAPHFPALIHLTLWHSTANFNPMLAKLRILHAHAISGLKQQPTTLTSTKRCFLNGKIYDENKY